ncbi:hypothetical protein Micbo1qcDRAFT_7936 [Microdochium bolleyi]|uniref:Subtelomeric hrmA-associated cluster protein AFUB-079030/YDR124W-like helical bundle domain-containing protein n=1 Tax=Microdochium bolleyi TaxID=196109 RepID=A0A136JJW7_9PEZI|nr:hypothetical protein Micbo1qcDRAFT_7936 [Microdochium bolleyi]
MGNQTRPRTDQYGWLGKPSAQSAPNTALGEKRCGENQQSSRGPPLPIDEALRNYCNIPGRGYLVVAIDQDYESHVFQSANCPADIERYVDKKGLKAHMLKLKNSSQTSVNVLKRSGSDSQYYQSSVGRPDGEGLPNAKKRLRHTPTPYDDEPAPESPRPVPTSKGRRIRIDNSKEIWEFYEQQFKNCQQTACKLIAKAWVKAVEPKKQSTHPYTGKDEKAPEWWPKPWGTSKDERVRHKEPDHLYKRERVYLLCHILRLVIQPLESQHPAIRKVNLDVRKLDEITMEALSTFFTDKENPNNEKKRPYLRDIFKVARQEERFGRGEIDPSACVHVRPDERVSGEDDLHSQNDDDESQGFSSTSEPTKQHGTPQILVNHEAQISGASMGRSSFSDGAFLGSQPRFHQSGTMDNGGLPSAFHQHESLGLGDDFMYAGSEATARRSSAYPSTATDFTSPTTSVTSWYTTAAAQPTTMYTMHTAPPNNVHSQQTVHLSHDLLGMDDFSRGYGHQPTHGGELHATLDPMSLTNHTAYSSYATHHEPGMPSVAKMETHHPGLAPYPSR